MWVGSLGVRGRFDGWVARWMEFGKTWVTWTEFGTVARVS